MTQALLSGMRVVEGSAFVAAPSAGMTLAQLGADVIRFDQIGGGIDYTRWPVAASGTSLYWAGLNKGKRSIAVDLRSADGQELLTAIICAPGADAGIFLTNFPARGWMSYDRLQQRRGDLVMAVLTGNHDGSSAVDYTVNCAVGYPNVTGPTDRREPTNHVLPAWDLIAGQTLVAAILAAERHRLRSGEGQVVEIALADVALHAVATLGHVGEAIVNGTERGRFGNDLYGAFGRDFPTSDGQRVMVAAISPKQWRSLREATETTAAIEAIATTRGVDFTDEGARFEHRDEIAGAVAPWIAARPMSEVAAEFDRHEVLWGRYQSFLELVTNDPRCSTANPMFADLDQPGIGTYLAPGSVMNLSGAPRNTARPAPRLGQHTEEILAELGMSNGEIASLYDRAVVA